MANVVVSSYSLASFFDIVNALVVDGFGFLVKKQVGVLSAVLFQTIALFIPNCSQAGNLDRTFLLGRACRLREGSQGQLLDQQKQEALARQKGEARPW